MWQSIMFTIYAALYINLILQQLKVDRNYMYNTSLKNIVTGLRFDSGSSGSKNI